MDRTDQSTPEDFGDITEQFYIQLTESASPDEFTFVYLTYNSELLLKVRELYFNARINEFASKRDFSNIPDDIEDVKQFAKILIENEISLMDDFQQRMKSNGRVNPAYDSEFIEVTKYQFYLKGRLANYNNLANHYKIESPSPPSNPFKLAGRKGDRITIIRILNAVYYLRCIVKLDGQLPTKAEFMKYFGDFLGIDLSGYYIDLNQTRSAKPETNFNIFYKLIDFTKTFLGSED